MNRNETKTKSAKVRLTNNVLHGYRLIKFCVKLRLCKPEYNGKMSEEKCRVIRTLPSGALLYTGVDFYVCGGRGSK